MPEAAAPPPAPRRLRAVTRRVPRHPATPSNGEDGDHAEGEIVPEPNMRLSRALGVMLLLHVVAFGGVLAFGTIKERPAGQTGHERPARTVRPGERPGGSEPRVAPDHAPTPFPVAPSSASPVSPGPVAVRPVPSPALTRVEADAVRLIESSGPNPLGGNERSYVVGRGETVQAIAQKLRVEPAALMRLNHVDDPRQIQVGQKLRVPPASGRSRS